MNDPERTSRWSAKELVKRGLFRAVKNDTVWALLKRTVLPFSRYAEHARHTSWPVPNWDRVMQEAIKTTFPDLVVRHGVFKGMRYPEARSSGSALYPKLLGSYERELEPILEAICQRPYGQVVDIGCAEGYYAVGLAMRIPSARVYAYDTNAAAIRLCRQMARVNNVEDRLITGAFCDRQTLRSIPFTGRGLIVCDCEGYELELLSADMIPFLARHDLLIEVHDFINIHISSTLRRLFEKTHDIQVIESLDDIRKAQTYAYPELEGYDLPTRRVLLGEYRPAIMEWMFLQSRDR